MAPRRFVNVFVEPNPACPDGCELRFHALGEPRPVAALRHWSTPQDGVLCDVVGWSSRDGGSACAAFAVEVDDSGAGVSTLVYGGDLGLRLTPRDGRGAFGEPYLLLDAADTFSGAAVSEPALSSPGGE